MKGAIKHCVEMARAMRNPVRTSSTKSVLENPIGLRGGRLLA
jgi:hypothetical protein